MTEKPVSISITIKVAETEIFLERQLAIREIEEGAQDLVTEIGQQVMKAGIEAVDERVKKQVPAGWRNVGTETRWMISSVGELQYKRRIYIDEKGQRRKPVDEILGLGRYGRISQRVKEMGAQLASVSTYRQAADQLSWMLKSGISHSSLQRMVWEIGNRIADSEEAEQRRIFEGGGEMKAGKVQAPVLYGESDGVWVHLQREKRKSVEVRVAILSNGRKPIGKNRYRLEHKCCLTAVGLDSTEWQEQIVRTAHGYYDLSQTKLLVSGGDGNQWVRHSFDRMGIHQEFILDRFHLHRAARSTFQDRTQARRIVKGLCEQGLEVVQKDIEKQINEATGKRKELLQEFYRYVHNNRDALLDLKQRGYSQPSYLGAIEGNVDKLVVHRMKGRGCCWRLPGLRAMLALCRHREKLQHHAYHYFPVQTSVKSRHPHSDVGVKYPEVWQKPMPVFQGPDQAKPWVRSLYHEIHG